MKKMVMSEEGIVYFVPEEDLKHGYWFNSDHSFDCFFNDLDDYKEWQEYYTSDEDTYRVLDEYIQSKGKKFDMFPCEEALADDELFTIFDNF
jgi:formylmethanofuran dehydrogenase subunit A